MSQDKLLELFPIPLMKFSCPFDYSKEVKWMKNQDCKKKNGLGNHQSIDTFILNHPELKRVRTFIETKLNSFMNSVYGSTKKLAITQSWLNKSDLHDFHHEHNHPNSIVSGVWYPIIDENSAPIMFKNNRQRDIEIQPERWNKYNSPTSVLPVKLGELILFPSTLSHSVPPNRSDKPRVSLSFNTWPIGSLGSIEHLTYLPLECESK